MDQYKPREVAERQANLPCNLSNNPNLLPAFTCLDHLAGHDLHRRQRLAGTQSHSFGITEVAVAAAAVYTHPLPTGRLADEKHVDLLVGVKRKTNKLANGEMSQHQRISPSLSSLGNPMHFVAIRLT